MMQHLTTVPLQGAAPPPLPRASPDSCAGGIEEAGTQLCSSAQAGCVNCLTLAILEQSTPTAPVCADALVLRAELRSDRHGRPYAAITLRLADGAILDARWWRFPSATRDCPSEGAVYRISGCSESFNGTQQLRVLDATVVPDADLTPFSPAVRRPLGELMSELQGIIAHVEQLDGSLAALVRGVLSEETYARFCIWPAAQRQHGALRHGLLAHSLQVVTLSLRLADAYEREGLTCDRALVMAGALLHDVGKVRTLSPIAGAALPEDAARFDHTTAGVLMVQQAAANGVIALDASRLEALLHIILAHHGRTEWGAAVEPQSVDAWLVHLADHAEARLWHYTEDAPAR